MICRFLVNHELRSAKYKNKANSILLKGKTLYFAQYSGVYYNLIQKQDHSGDFVVDNIGNIFSCNFSIGGVWYEHYARDK